MDHTPRHRDRVAAVGTVRRMQSLAAYGYPRTELLARLDIPGAAEDLFDPTTRVVTAAIAQRVRALFARLEATPGSCPEARADGRRRGWRVPLAWDEDALDDPAGRPDTSRDKPQSFAARYTELRELGYSDLLIINKMGIKPKSLARQLARHGMPTSPALWQEVAYHLPT